MTPAAAPKFDRAGDNKKAQNGLKIECRADRTTDRARASNRAKVRRNSPRVSRNAASVRAMAPISSGPREESEMARSPALRPFMATTNWRNGTAIERRPGGQERADDDRSPEDNARNIRRRSCFRNRFFARRCGFMRQLCDDRGQEFIGGNAMPAGLCQKTSYRQPGVHWCIHRQPCGRPPHTEPTRRGSPPPLPPAPGQVIEMVFHFLPGRGSIPLRQGQHADCEIGQPIAHFAKGDLRTIRLLQSRRGDRRS